MHRSLSRFSKVNARRSPLHSRHQGCPQESGRSLRSAGIRMERSGQIPKPSYNLLKSSPNLVCPCKMSLHPVKPANLQTLQAPNFNRCRPHSHSKMTATLLRRVYHSEPYSCVERETADFQTSQATIINNSRFPHPQQVPLIPVSTFKKYILVIPRVRENSLQMLQTPNTRNPHFSNGGRGLLTVRHDSAEELDQIQDYHISDDVELHTLISLTLHNYSASFTASFYLKCASTIPMALNPVVTSPSGA